MTRNVRLLRVTVSLRAAQVAVALPPPLLPTPTATVTPPPASPLLKSAKGRARMVQDLPTTAAEAAEATHLTIISAAPPK